MGVDHAKIEQAVRMILEAVGEDPDREGLVETPARVARMYEEIFSGLGQDPRDYFSVIFSEDHEELVLVKDIPFFSVMERLEPHGVVVVVEAEHMCMTMRGVKKPGSKTVTSAVRGIFSRDAAARAEAFSLIGYR